jgi:hypothetical protein
MHMARLFNAVVAFAGVVLFAKTGANMFLIIAVIFGAQAVF